MAAASDPDATISGDPDQAPRPTVRDVGDSIDRYRIRGQIGAGAMGVVYEAHDPALDRVVAVKLLRPGGRTDQRRSTRLLGEAKALAKLSHANVVSVYDLGTVGDELYIAMEFVEGVTLKEWLAAEQRTVPALLEVFVQIARGLTAAHAARLTHGDFKPANVIVDAQDHAKVLDFGLAQQADVANTENMAKHSLSHRVSGLVGTPAYMAPEQFAGLNATASTDQFAFCVALWEAAYGERPFAGSTVFQLSAAVTEGEMRSPVLGKRVPRWLNRALVRGLSNHPADRWPSMDGLRARLEVDRVRPRRALAVAGVVTVAAVGWGWAQTGTEVAARCEAEARASIAAWGEAQREVLRDVFTRSEAPYADTTRESVDRMLTEFLSEWQHGYALACMAGQDDVPDATRDRAYGCLTDRRQELGALVEALTGTSAIRVAVRLFGELQPVGSCSDAAYLARLSDGPLNPEVARQVGALRRRRLSADALRKVGSYSECDAHSAAIAEQARALGFPPLVTAADSTRALCLMGLDRLDEAEALFRSTYQTAVAEELGSTAADSALGMVGLKSLRGQYAQGREWAFHAEAQLRRRSSPERLRGNLQAQLGQLEGADQQVDAAIDHLRTAVKLAEADRGPEHWITASRKMLLATQLARKGDVAGARALQTQALEVLIKRFGDQHPEVAIAKNNLASTLIRLGETELAIAQLTAAAHTLHAQLGADHPTLAFAYTNLTSLHLDRDETDKALQYCNRAVEQRRRALPANHPHLGFSLVDCGDILRRLGRHDDALTTLEEALQIARAQGNPNHPSLAGSLVALARTLVEVGRPGDAVNRAERALALYDRPAREYGDADKSVAQITLATALAAEGSDPDRAKQLALDAIADLDHAPVASAGVLARDLKQWRAWAAALP